MLELACCMSSSPVGPGLFYKLTKSVCIGHYSVPSPCWTTEQIRAVKKWTRQTLLMWMWLGLWSCAGQKACETTSPSVRPSAVRRMRWSQNMLLNYFTINSLQNATDDNEVVLHCHLGGRHFYRGTVIKYRVTVYTWKSPASKSTLTILGMMNWVTWVRHIRLELPVLANRAFNSSCRRLKLHIILLKRPQN